MSNISNHIIMVSPDYFEFNSEAASSNSFQNSSNLPLKHCREKALSEFKTAVKKLRDIGVKVSVFNSLPDTPDSVFPNNWFSTHSNGKLFIYPMEAENRRNEINPEIIDFLTSEYPFELNDLSPNVSNKMFLEGTGSLVFDYENKKCYAVESSRTNIQLVQNVCDKLGFDPVCFKALDQQNKPIYHTNVVLTIGETFIAIGIDTIDESDKKKVINSLNESGKEIIFLKNEQIFESFAGNMIQLANNKDQKILVLSKTAHDSLSSSQLNVLKKHNEILCPIEIPIIEHIGGGSARCMIAEIYKPIKPEI